MEGESSRMKIDKADWDLQVAEESATEGTWLSRSSDPSARQNVEMEKWNKKAIQSRQESLAE